MNNQNTEYKQQIAALRRGADRFQELGMFSLAVKQMKQATEWEKWLIKKNGGRFP